MSKNKIKSSIFSVLQNQAAVFTIAEIGANHNGDMTLAKKMIDAAKAAGCDAVKFQSWSKTSLFAKVIYDQDRDFSHKSKASLSLEETMEKLSLSLENHRVLKEYCDQKGIFFSSSAFSPAEVEMLDALDVPYIKIASMDVNHPVILESAAQTGRPIFLSTGMASFEEIDAAVRLIRKAGNDQIVLLHCVSLYPPDDAMIHLKNMDLLRDTFKLPVGFSDHSPGCSIALAAIARGAVVIEKHFTTDKTLPGWDHAMSMDPGEMENIVREGKRIVKALGSHERIVSQQEMEQRKRFRRSIVARREIAPGETITLEKLDFKRPGTGIRPDELERVVGKRVVKKIAYDALLAWEDLERV